MSSRNDFGFDRHPRRHVIVDWVNEMASLHHIKHNVVLYVAGPQPPALKLSG